MGVTRCIMMSHLGVLLDLNRIWTVLEYHTVQRSLMTTMPLQMQLISMTVRGSDLDVFAQIPRFIASTS